MPAWTDGVCRKNRTVRDEFYRDGGVILQRTGSVTKAAGAMITTMLDFSLRGSSALDSRQFQLGFKFNF